MVLGPGPGHPSVYQKIWQAPLEKLLKAKHVFVMGICLGHQLIFMHEGLEVMHAKSPAHGKIFQYALPSQWQKLAFDSMISVQRYNSLAVICEELNVKSLTKKGYMVLCQEDELVMAHNRRLISYQFHPESVGTIYPHKFFGPIVDFLL